MTNRKAFSNWMLVVAIFGAVTMGGVLMAQDSENESRETAALDGSKVQRVTLKGNRVIEGKVTQTADGDIRIESKFGTLTFDAADVVSVDDIVSARQAYERRKVAIKTDDAEALYTLAKWVMDEHGDNRDLLLSARQDLQKAIELKKDYADAALLLKIVDGKLKSFDVPDDTNGPAAKNGQDGTNLVTQRDIYSIRIAEVRDTDRVVVKYQNDVLDRFIELMRRTERPGWDQRSTERRFRGLSRSKQMAYMIEQEPSNWDIQKDILIQRDPQFMIDFRNKVWPILRRTAASDRNNHGANLLDGYKFKINASGGERVDYTNFVILVGYKRGRARLVDRQKPEDSLILKAGLTQVIDPETDPRTIVPAYQTVNSEDYKTILAWIKSLKGPMEPDYHLEWKPKGKVVIDCDGKPDLPLGATE